MNSKEVLYKYWGYSAFRPLQEDIIETVLNGNDCLALLPTGGGKSVCFQVPALLMEGICIVVTPLISLMKDQVEHLRKKEIPALCIYSGMSFKQVDNILQLAINGKYKFLYVSPERLETKLFLSYLPAMEVNMIAVDEAHCVSQWGYDFRPAYLRIADIREALKKVVVLALSASATKEVQNDICEKLLFRKKTIFQSGFDRPNLSYSCFETEAKINKAIEIINKVPGTGILYCKSRRQTKEICDLLLLHHINADYYHAGLDAETRMGKQLLWIDNKIRIMVCTNAFGMGIDKPDVRLVIHYQLPDCIENYYQEAGRAGRDGKKAYAVLLFRKIDISLLNKSVAVKFPEEEAIKHVYLSICNALQLTYGSGEGCYFDFDLNIFCKNFKLEILHVINCLKILEQEEILSYAPSVIQPSTVQFITNKEGLFAFEKTHPHLDPLIKTLLRTYSGIFDYPVFISEKNLAYIEKQNIADLINNLKQLHYLGIVEYKPVKDQPQLFFIKERLHSENFGIDAKKYLERKERYEFRIKKMGAFTLLKSNCRSQFISNYFGIEDALPCGTCDNCLQLKKQVFTATDIEKVATAILGILHTDTTINLNNPTYTGLNQSKEILQQALDFLIAEEKIKLEGDSILLNTP